MDPASCLADPCGVLPLDMLTAYTAEDDERWWSFGDGTVAALKTFQVSFCLGCVDLPVFSCRLMPECLVHARVHAWRMAGPRPGSLQSPGCHAVQACNGYPESGVCDAATWRMLLGDDAHPSEIADLRSGDSADEDLSAQVGEGREGREGWGWVGAAELSAQRCRS